jgi:putative nucleotidyltransferase with HDIG domain
MRPLLPVRHSPSVAVADIHEHGLRVAALSERIGRALGLSLRERDALWIGARMHDIGKVGVRKSILEKSGPLTRRERAAMERHPVHGEEIARRLGAPQEARLIVRHHHERWDGTGYPDGLRGEAIPLLARIVAVADAYDAVTHDRPYRTHLPHAAAMRELERRAGTQFDPHIVAVALEAIKSERFAS